MGRTENVELTVLCLIEDGDKILLQNRVKKDWRGYTLPGGHVEPGESFIDAVIREMREETGLKVIEPRLVGVKQFPIENGRYVVLLFKATQWSGDLLSSDEGHMEWIEYDRLPVINTVDDFDELRVLKPGGICLCMSARKGLQITAPCLELTEAEKDFWESVSQSNDELEKYGVGKYRLSEAELPASMEQNGFVEVTTGYALIDLTPDAPKYSSQMAEEMFESMRQNDLEAIQSMHSACAQKAISAVNSKYDERVRLYHERIRQWDTTVSVTMIVRGRKK